MKRWGKSDEIAKAVLFLAFDATFTTGAELHHDAAGLTSVPSDAQDHELRRRARAAGATKLALA